MTLTALFVDRKEILSIIYLPFILFFSYVYIKLLWEQFQTALNISSNGMSVTHNEISYYLVTTDFSNQLTPLIDYFMSKVLYL